MSNQTGFIQSFLVGLIFIPYHFVCEVSRKLVFMQREKIEQLLKASAIMAAVVSAISLAYGVYVRQLLLFSGVFPLVVPIASACILFLMYAYFKSMNFKLYDNLNDFVTLDEVLQDAVQESQIVELGEEAAVEDMVEITDVEDGAEDEQVHASPAEDALLDVEAELSGAMIGQDAIALSATKAQKATTIDVASAVPIDVQNAMQQALKEAEAKTAQNSAIVKDAPVPQPNAANLAIDAKKALYKNKMLKALGQKLNKLECRNCFTAEEIDQICSEELFIKSTEFVSPILSLEDILES